MLVVEAANDNGAMRSMVGEHARGRRLIPLTNGARSSGLSRSAGPRKRSPWRLPCRSARSRSCACSPTCCRRCSIRWRRATCRTSSSFVRSRRLRSRSRSRSGRRTSRKGRSAGVVVERRAGAAEEADVCPRRQLRRRSGPGLWHRMGRGSVRAGRSRTAATPPMSRAFLGAQQEWMTNHLPKKGDHHRADIAGASPNCRRKAERVYGKPAQGRLHGYVYRSRRQGAVGALPDARAEEAEGGRSAAGSHEH